MCSTLSNVSKSSSLPSHFNPGTQSKASLKSNETLIQENFPSFCTLSPGLQKVDQFVKIALISSYNRRLVPKSPQKYNKVDGYVRKMSSPQKKLSKKSPQLFSENSVG